MLCRKLTDTPFPFPWVQAVNIALLLYTLLAPVAVVGFTDNIVLATTLTFMAVATHVTLNEVASDIEDPFHYDPNELPLPQVPHPKRQCSLHPWTQLILDPLLASLPHQGHPCWCTCLAVLPFRFHTPTSICVIPPHHRVTANQVCSPMPEFEMPSLKCTCDCVYLMPSPSSAAPRERVEQGSGYKGPAMPGHACMNKMHALCCADAVQAERAAAGRALLGAAPRLHRCRRPHRPGQHRRCTPR